MKDNDSESIARKIHNLSYKDKKPDFLKEFEEWALNEVRKIHQEKLKSIR